MLGAKNNIGNTRVMMFEDIPITSSLWECVSKAVKKQNIDGY